MGEVFEAEHEHTKRRVALKLIRAEAAGHDETAERLRREGRAASAIGDPNIVDVTDFGVTDDGSAYMVMEWIDGKTLRELLNSGPVARSEVLNLAAQAASGLVSAHGIGVVHRDIKPENLMVMVRKDGSQQLKILDFGIAKVGGPDLQKLTRTGTIIGTPAYMSPEQARGEPVDARSDVYSLGCVIYELFTGLAPFASPSLMEIVMMQTTTQPTLPSLRAPDRDISTEIDRIIMRCLAKDVGQRYQSMTDLRSDLLEQLHQRPTHSIPVQGEAIRQADLDDQRDLAKTLHYRGRSPAASGSPPIDTAPARSTRRPLLVGILLALIAALVLVLVVGRDTGNSQVASGNAPAPTDAQNEVGDATPVAKRLSHDASLVANDAGLAFIASPTWSFERKHSKFSIVLNAPALLSARQPIDLAFELHHLRDKLSWGVTEGRLRARIDFVHFVRHDTMGRVSAKVDDQGRFRAILSVPQTGKYHLKIRLSDGSKVVGRSQIDICVGAKSGTPAATSLCPQLNEFAAPHDPAR